LAESNIFSTLTISGVLEQVRRHGHAPTRTVEHVPIPIGKEDL